MASEAQVRANRLNAQRSTGPRTAEGKAAVAQNAVKHGLLAEQAVNAAVESEDGRVKVADGVLALTKKNTLKSKHEKMTDSLTRTLKKFGDPALVARYAEKRAKLKEIASDENQPVEERSEPLREIILARALYRCGDHEGLGQTILREYAQDLRGHFARHATAVLERGQRGPHATSRADDRE